MQARSRGDLLAQRKKEGKKTTFYVCVHPKKPNTFTISPLAEAEWLPLFAAANHLDGFLRWAYNSWNRNPFEKTDFGNWPAGDCYLVYPGNLSSLRFEKLRDGLEEFEKVNILRARAAKNPKAKAAVARMDEELSKLFTVEKSRGNSHEEDVRESPVKLSVKRRKFPVDLSCGKKGNRCISMSFRRFG